MYLAFGVSIVIYLSSRCCKGSHIHVDFMKKFWPMYNIMQLVCILVVMDIVTPANVTKVLTAIKEELELVGTLQYAVKSLTE